MTDGAGEKWRKKHESCPLGNVIWIISGTIMKAY